jgi:predicted RNA binding protein YcfA (HicA-like mRNA interferase family)
MAGNSPVPYREVERAFKRGGASHARTTGSHFTWIYKSVPVVIVVHNNEVKMPYINKARKSWGLWNLNDKKFWEGDWP